MKRIALIVHRYDKTIGSGAENLAMMYAQHLKNRFVVEVLTTTCLDTDSWSNALPQGQEEIDGIIVHRFPTVHGRDQKNFPTLSILQADCIARGNLQNISRINSGLRHKDQIARKCWNIWIYTERITMHLFFLPISIILLCVVFQEWQKRQFLFQPPMMKYGLDREFFRNCLVCQFALDF